MPATVPSVDLPVVQDLLDRCRSRAPSTAGIAAEAVQIVTRPWPVDGYPPWADAARRGATMLPSCTAGSSSRR